MPSAPASPAACTASARSRAEKVREWTSRAARSCRPAHTCFPSVRRQMRLLGWLVRAQVPTGAEQPQIYGRVASFFLRNNALPQRRRPQPAPSVAAPPSHPPSSSAPQGFISILFVGLVVYGSAVVLVSSAVSPRRCAPLRAAARGTVVWRHRCAGHDRDPRADRRERACARSKRACTMSLRRTPPLAQYTVPLLRRPRRMLLMYETANKPRADGEVDWASEEVRTAGARCALHRTAPPLNPCGVASVVSCPLCCKMATTGLGAQLLRSGHCTCLHGARLRVACRIAGHRAGEAVVARLVAAGAGYRSR